MTAPIRSRLRAPACLVLPALALLAGCATNQLRLDYAGDVAALGRSTATAADGFLDKVEDARIAANVELAVADPNCLPRTAHVRQPPDFQRLAPDGTLARGWLCAAGAEQGTRPLSLAAPDREFEPTIQLIAALGSYADTIARILEGKGSDEGEDFNETLALLDKAAGAMGALAAVDDGRLAAIGAFAAFVADLAREQRKVDQLRRLAASTQGGAELAGELQDHLIRWDGSRRSDLALQANLASEMMTRAFRAEPPAPPETRRELIAAYYARERGAREERLAYEVLGALFADLARADTDMRRVLAEDPDLTAAERATVRRALLTRVGSAFETAQSLLSAF